MNLSDTSMDSNLLVRIDAKKKRLDAHRPLPKTVLQQLHENMVIEWTYNSNAIEGNSLTLRETLLVLREGMTVKGKSFDEHLEAKNHEKAILHLDHIVHKKNVLSERTILDLHAMILDNIEEEYAGRYRSGQVRIIGANFVPPNALKIKAHMKNLVDQLTSRNSHPVLHAARIHHQFVWIHPFIDGNGRTGRLLMNLLLMRNGFPPAVILKNDRKKYYEALNQANQNNFGKLELLVGQAVERSLDIYLAAIEAASTCSEYVPLRVLADEYAISQEYLSLLARRGKIDAYKERRNWVSNREAIEKYFKKKIGTVFSIEQPAPIP